MFQLIEDSTGKRIRLETRISSEGADAFRNLLLDLLETPEAGIRFDFSDVREIDAVILGIFISFANTVAKECPGLRLEILHAGPDIVNLFQMARLDQRYTFHPKEKVDGSQF